MGGPDKPIQEEGARGRYSPGIRMKLFGILLPFVFLLIASVTWVVAGVTKATLRRDLLQRGAAVSRVVALSAGHSLLSRDTLGLDRLVSETRASDPDIAFVAIRDASDIVAAHDRVAERVKAVPSRSTHPSTGNLRRHAGGRGNSRRTAAHRIYDPHLLRRTARGDRLPRTLHGGSRDRAAGDPAADLRGGGAVILVVAIFGTLLLSSLITTPVKRLHKGVLSLASSETFQPVPVHSSDELGALTRNFNRMAETILAQKTALQNQKVDLQEKANKLEEAYNSMVRVIAASLDAKDPYTMGHSIRVARMSCALGRRLGMDEEELSDLEKAAIFHDIGKIQTPDDVLLKGERLSHAEEKQMKSHSVDGTEILRMAPFLHRYIPVVRAHHEWYNGEGYPDGIKGDEIPLHAQLIALAEAYDAMTTDQPYREAHSPEEAIGEILKFRGTQFSPELADAFAKMVREMPPINETIQ